MTIIVKILNRRSDFQISILMFLMYEGYSLCFKFFINFFGIHMERWVIARSFEYNKVYFLIEIVLFTLFETYLISKVADDIHKKYHRTSIAITCIALIYALFYMIMVHPLYGVFMYPYALVLMYVHEYYKPKKMSCFMLFLCIHGLLNLVPAIYACMFL